MYAYNTRIRDIATRILDKSEVEMVIGFKKGSIPMMNEPGFITNADEAHQLYWDSHCGINLANYLTNRKEKIGILAKGCDSRNIITHIIENKIKREQLFIIGIPCRGMIDKRKIETLLTTQLKDIIEANDQVIVKTDQNETSLARADVLQENCKICIHPNPVIFDELVDDPITERTYVDRYADIRKIEAMPTAEKWAFFETLLTPCIRCYACRNACPLCYCPTCFVDESRPQWVGKGQDPTDVFTFHFLRAFHCAGRCTDCGACQRACPVGINVRIFTKKLEKDCLELYDWEAGLSLDTRPPLDTYRPEDPGEFIK